MAAEKAIEYEEASDDVKVLWKDSYVWDNPFQLGELERLFPGAASWGYWPDMNDCRGAENLTQAMIRRILIQIKCPVHDLTTDLDHAKRLHDVIRQQYGDDALFSTAEQLQLQSEMQKLRHELHALRTGALSAADFKTVLACVRDIKYQNNALRSQLMNAKLLVAELAEQVSESVSKQIDFFASLLSSQREEAKRQERLARLAEKSWQVRLEAFGKTVWYFLHIAHHELDKLFGLPGSIMGESTSTRKDTKPARYDPYGAEENPRLTSPALDDLYARMHAQIQQTVKAVDSEECDMLRKFEADYASLRTKTADTYNDLGVPPDDVGCYKACLDLLLLTNSMRAAADTTLQLQKNVESLQNAAKEAAEQVSAAPPEQEQHSNSSTWSCKPRAGGSLPTGLIELVKAEREQHVAEVESCEKQMAEDSCLAGAAAEFQAFLEREPLAGGKNRGKLRLASARVCELDKLQVDLLQEKAVAAKKASTRLSVSLTSLRHSLRTSRSDTQSISLPYGDIDPKSPFGNISIQFLGGSIREDTISAVEEERTRVSELSDRIERVRRLRSKHYEAMVKLSEQRASNIPQHMIPPLYRSLSIQVNEADLLPGGGNSLGLLQPLQTLRTRIRPSTSAHPPRKKSAASKRLRSALISKRFALKEKPQVREAVAVPTVFDFPLPQALLPNNLTTTTGKPFSLVSNVFGRR
ncbi:hypothetical protein DIPPA_12002 [Diplonema papillatum]|nr:hypothetical protein DIPPA_12002 [Diplonema papillatum]